MSAIADFAKELDHVTRRLLRDLEWCDRALVSCCNVTTAQAGALLTVAEYGPVTMNELASHMRLHGTTMTRMVDALVSKGLVRRAEDAEDRRVVRVGLTIDGQHHVTELQRAKEEFYSAALAGMSITEQGEMLALLKRLAQVADQMAERCCG